MGKAWAEASPEARATFEEADDALGFTLSKLCWEGPEEELNLTVNTQPALLAVSAAIHRAWPSGAGARARGGGRALAWASTRRWWRPARWSFADALRLVRRRGQLMQEAVPVGVGAMAAVIGLDAEASAALAADAQSAAGEGQLCAVANLNGPGQTVLAGHKAAVDLAVAMAKERGARKATLPRRLRPLPLAADAPAREGMAEVLARAAFRDPRVPVVSNVDAAPVITGDAARDALVRQIDSPVRWVESMERMVADFGVDTFLEMGPGTVLCGLNRRIVQGTMSASFSDPEQVAKLLSGSGEGEKGA